MGSSACFCAGAVQGQASAAQQGRVPGVPERRLAPLRRPTLLAVLLQVASQSHAGLVTEKGAEALAGHLRTTLLLAMVRARAPPHMPVQAVGRRLRAS